MDSILFRIHKKDCKEVSSSIAENGFLEITVPKTDTADTALNKYLRDLSGEKRDEIVTLQKKNNEAFRKKVKKLIDKYQKEFDLPFVTTWILGNVTRIPRHELPQTLDFSDFLPLFT